MASGEVDGAIEFTALNFVGYGGSGSEGVAENCADAVLLEDVDGEDGEFFGVETGVVGHEDGRLGGFRFGVFGDGGDSETDSGEREIVGDESTPAGGAKFYRGSGDARRSAHIFTSGLASADPENHFYARVCKTNPETLFAGFASTTCLAQGV